MFNIIDRDPYTVETEIGTAIKNQDVSSLRHLLQAQPHFATLYDDQLTYLHIACSYSCPSTPEASQTQVEIIRLLLGHGAEIDAWTWDYNDYHATALLIAVTMANTPVVKILVENGAERREMPGTYNANPIKFAIDIGNLEVLSLMLETDQSLDYYRELLHQACFRGCASTISFLLERKEFKDVIEYREPDAMNSTWEQEPWIKYTALLCTVWCDFDMDLKNGVSEEDRRDAIMVLIKEGADLKACDGEGSSVFIGAAKCGCSDVVEKMLRDGHSVFDDEMEDMEADGTQREVPSGPIEHSKQLRSSAIHFAAEGRHLGMVELLLEHGADVNARDTWGRSPLHYAIEGRNSDPMVTILHHDVKRRLEMLELLLRHGADVNAMDDDKVTPLHRATTKPGAFPLVEKLVDSGADVNTRSIKNEEKYISQTPLISTFDHPDKECFELLLSKGADVHVRDDHGHTALYQACSAGEEDMVRLLIEAGAEIDAPDNLGKTPFLVTVNNGSLTCQELLREAGADESLVDNKERGVDYYRGRYESGWRCSPWNYEILSNPIE